MILPLHDGATAFGAVLVGGIVSAFNPCCLSMSPAMMALVADHHARKLHSALVATLVICGFATTMAALGALSSTLGLIFGHMGHGFSYAVSAIPILMALQMLGVIDIHLSVIRMAGLDGHLGAMTAGAAYALVVAPCATPILASILAYSASKGNIVYGTSLLWVYGVGFCGPLCAFGALFASLRRTRMIGLNLERLNAFTAVVLMLLGLSLLWKA